MGMSDMADLPVLKLKRGEERRLRAGHLWVYSNEVDVAATPLKGLEPGAEVVVADHRGKPLGRAYANPNSLICARLFSRDIGRGLDSRFFERALGRAGALRERLFDRPFYRLAFGEGDLLPGLVIDRYDDTFVIQSGTAGIDRALPALVEALHTLYAPRNIVVKSESATRAQEGLEADVRALAGELPDDVAVEENGVRYSAPLARGQKTGWFYDHRAARRRLPGLVRDARVLDVFSYCGAWGVLAAVAGAREVTCIDSSSLALEYVHRNARANSVDDRVRSIEADAMGAMKELIAGGERFDVVIIDPPAFIKRRKDVKKGLGGYHALNELAVRLVEPGGMLVSASCSMHLGREQLLDVMRASARHIDRHLQVFAAEGQAEDHPLHPAMPETAYLKTWFARVLMNL